MSNFHYDSYYLQSNSIFGNNRMSRRIEREIDKLMGMYHVELSIKTDKNKDRITSFYIYDDKNRIINITLPHGYPFHPPQLMIQNKKTSKRMQYQHLYKWLSEFYLKNLPEFNSSTNHTCICCCNNIIKNWHPGKNIMCVLQENRSYEEWFKTLKTTYYGKQTLIKKKLIKEIITCILEYIYEPVPTT